jgi:hypothetical protein
VVRETRTRALTARLAARFIVTMDPTCGLALPVKRSLHWRVYDADRFDS